jgi:hypothetical protein
MERTFTFDDLDDLDDGDEATIVVRTADGGVGLTLSKKAGGDIEAFMPRLVAADVAAELREASIRETAPSPDPARGAVAAMKLKALGAKPILVRAAELGYITQMTCNMPQCFCPEELGGARYFEPVTKALSDWSPTHEHFPRAKRDGGHRTVDNAVLAHRLCNRIDFSITSGRSYRRDLERIRKAREAAAGR